MNQGIRLVLLLNFFTMSKMSFAQEKPIYTPDCKLQSYIKEKDPSIEVDAKKGKSSSSSSSSSSNWYIKEVSLIKECGDKPFLVGFQKEEGNSYRIQFCRPKGSRITDELSTREAAYNAATLNLKYSIDEKTNKWKKERFESDFKTPFVLKVNSSGVAEANSMKTNLKDHEKHLEIFVLGKNDTSFKTIKGTVTNKFITNNDCEFNIVRDELVKNSEDQKAPFSIKFSIRSKDNVILNEKVAEPNGTFSTKELTFKGKDLPSSAKQNLVKAPVTIESEDKGDSKPGNGTM